MHRAPPILLAAACFGGCPGEPPAPPTVEALAGEGGVALFVDGSLEGWALGALDVDGDVRAVPVTDSSPLIDPEGTAGITYQLTADGASTIEITPQALSLIDSTAPAPPLLLAGEALSLGLALDGGDATLASGSLQVRRTTDDGEVSYLGRGCLSQDTLGSHCWQEEPTALEEDVPAGELADHAFSLPPYTPAALEPRSTRFGLYLRMADQEGGEVLAGGDLRAVFLGRSLRFGDLHAHSNLSHDGCEDVEAGCADRGDGPAEEFFADALAADLDFAALTDHAEWDVLQTEGETAIHIWDATLDVIEAALPLEDEGFVPLLGYEWTHFVRVWDTMEPWETGDDYRDELTAGHKTVLFRQTTACEAYRVGANTETEMVVKGDSGQSYTQAEGHVEALSVDEFRARMDDAAETCGELDWMTFFHHPGYLVPSPVDWALPENAPDPDRERLVEIASEHGSSECRDPTMSGCGFWVEEDGFHQYLRWGSVQEALALGFRLGFLGGTDSHDSRPGSVDDGPSEVGIFIDTDGDGEPDSNISMFHDGAISGVFVEGDYGRQALWNALSDRNTLATTGPRGRLALAAVTPDGLVALPGDELMPDVFPLELSVVAEPGDPYQVERIEVVEPDGGTVLHHAEGSSLVTELSDPGTDAVYVRVRIWDGGNEHRVWFSPLFIVR